MLIALALGFSLFVARAQAQTLTYRGTSKLPADAADQNGKRFAISGASGISFGGGDVFWAVLDNSDKLVRLKITFKPTGEIDACEIVMGLTLSEPHDYEGVAVAGEHVFVSEENTPAIHEFDLRDGKKIRTLDTPAVYRKHLVRNQGFESLTLSADGKSLWTANERALKIDGNSMVAAEVFGSATRVRLQRYTIDGEKITPAEQYEYDTSGVHDAAGQIGLCDLAALADGRLLTLERSAGENLAKKFSARTRIFLIDVKGATDISGADSDTGVAKLAPWVVKKKLLFDQCVVDENGENFEGLCIGPKLGENRWAVIGVVDDGDGPLRVSSSRVIAFELKLPLTPSPRTRR